MASLNWTKQSIATCPIYQRTCGQLRLAIYFATKAEFLTTPMARSLIKKELGEFVEVETPGGIKEYEIIEIKLI